jgi:hypothetical protein
MAMTRPIAAELRARTLCVPHLPVIRVSDAFALHIQNRNRAASGKGAACAMRLFPTAGGKAK